MVSRLWPDPRYLHRGISRGILRLSVDPVNCPNCHHPVDEHIAIIMCNLIGCTCESDALDDIEISYKDLREKTEVREPGIRRDRKSTRLNSSHTVISYAVFCLKKKT